MEFSIKVLLVRHDTGFMQRGLTVEQHLVSRHQVAVNVLGLGLAIVVSAFKKESCFVLCLNLAKSPYNFILSRINMVDKFSLVLNNLKDYKTLIPVKSVFASASLCTALLASILLTNPSSCSMALAPGCTSGPFITI